MALSCLPWMFVRARKLRRFMKLVFIVLVSSSILYFALISFNATRNFTEEEQRTNNTREHVRNPQQTVMSDSDGNSNEEVQRANDTREEGQNGRLAVSIWRDMCGEEVKVLQNSPFYPSFPDEKKFIHEFQIEENKAEYGQTIIGFVHPAISGSYRFAIASDDSSELWLSPSEEPEEKQLIASVSAESATGWTKKNELNKYPNQVSRDVKLRNGSRYYIEVIHKQGAGDGFVQVFWLRPGDADFQLISSGYLSSYSDDIVSIVSASKKDAMNKLHVFRIAEKTWKNYSNFFSLPLISEGNYLPQCTYKSSFIIKEKIDKYAGVKLVNLSNVFPEDDTFMGNKGDEWSWSNRVADQEMVQSVVDNMIASLCTKTAK